MAFDINTFKTQGPWQGGARPTQFKVTIDVPPATAGGGTQTGVQTSTTAKNQIQFMVQSASLPAWSIQPAVLHYFGRQIKFQGDRVVSDWQVSVINDEGFDVRTLLEKWSNDINTMVSNRLNATAFSGAGVSPLVGYKTSATVVQYGKAGNPIRHYKMIGLWPTEVGAIELSWQAQNQIEQFSCNFAMDHFETYAGAADSGNPVPGLEVRLSGTEPA